ncbi:MAG: precorrin-2 C(20)-methyltransferase [Syntrophomonadaceae bacterium]|nr:precorrin-2 C(20)-methyltransferase [Syntrophomonadaceae bacterium]
MKPAPKKAGQLYGIGVGPGDPELMTLKAVRLLKECQIIAVPAAGKDRNTAYEIVKCAVPGITAKEILELSMPMTRDHKRLESSHEAAALKVIAELDRGQNVAFITLGDPSIYSTYLYVHTRVVARGYNARIVPGVPSFCAAAARLNEGLTEAAQALHIIPASYDGIEEALALKGTRVLMKAGKSLREIKTLIGAMQRRPSVKLVERCGMQGERVFNHLEDMDDQASYFSIMIVKDEP